jgi:hypothetical protein
MAQHQAHTQRFFFFNVSRAFFAGGAGAAPEPLLFTLGRFFCFCFFAGSSAAAAACISAKAVSNSFCSSSAST